MASVTTFYFSRVLGNQIVDESGKPIGKLKDLVAELGYIRPKIIAAEISTKEGNKSLDFKNISIEKLKGQYILRCKNITEIKLDKDGVLYLGKNVLDRQIVDMDGKKLVRVNDLRLAVLSSDTYLIAVDVGLEGILRRLGIAKPLKKLLKPFGINIPAHYILWDDVETVDYNKEGIKLSKDFSNLAKLHPSDLADIIEDMDNNTQMAVFSALDDEKAADVLEELETDAQISLIERLSVEKAADLLEKMPADEAADILDELKHEKAEELLNEMEDEMSEEVRELMEYPDNTVGSLMTTDFIYFNENDTVGQVIEELRKLKPEPDTIYYLYVVNNSEKLVSTVSLRDIIVSEPETRLKDIMNKNVVYVYDYDKIESLNDIISKYNLLAVPVVNENDKLIGMVVINDVVYHLLKAKRKRL